ncbi:MAG: rRNA maturation RNase YbeY [Candidatus Paceibacterota bacterium]
MSPIKDKKVEIINLTKGKLPRLPFSDMKDSVLGKNYELSLTIVGPSKIHELNKRYRNMNMPTDILSFTLSKNEGEIFICPSLSRREAKKFNRTYENFIGFLFIHGLLHLKGMDHSSTMEAEEAKYRSKFKI